MNAAQAHMTCACGRRKSGFAKQCHKCEKDAREARHAAARAIVAAGKCPDCGAGLKRNLSLTGWWQCEQFGAEQFRKDPSRPSCSFQTFTE